MSNIHRYALYLLAAVTLVVAACEKSPDGRDGKTYIAIVNKDYKNDMTLDIAFTAKATKIDNMGLKGEAKSERVTVSPGNIIIYQLN